MCKAHKDGGRVVSLKYDCHEFSSQEHEGMFSGGEAEGLFRVRRAENWQSLPQAR